VEEERAGLFREEACRDGFDGGSLRPGRLGGHVARLGEREEGIHLGCAPFDARESARDELLERGTDVLVSRLELRDGARTALSLFRGYFADCVRTHCLSVSGRMPQRDSSDGMSAEYPTASNHSSIKAKSTLFARTASIGIGW